MPKSLFDSKFDARFYVFYRAVCNGKKYIASGSEQEELRGWCFFKKGVWISILMGFFGSPTGKAKLVENILKKERSCNAVMFGDAESDMLSAQKNHIDFVFYKPFF